MDISERAKKIRGNLLPKKSENKYRKTFKDFQTWMAEQGLDNISEDVVLVYLESKENLAPTSLWSIFSMLKKSLPSHNFNQYHSVKSFLKKKNVGYAPKKSLCFSEEELTKFYSTAPDSKFLLAKVIMILGIAGTMRSNELWKLGKNAVKKVDERIVVDVLETKNYKNRQFFVVNTATINYVDIVWAYMQLRPENRVDERFFFAYSNGRASNLAVGQNLISSIPARVAEYLGLDSTHDYSGHALRRTGATLMANRGASLVQLMQQGGWSSATVAQGYAENSTVTKLNAAQMILGQETNPPQQGTSKDSLSSICDRVSFTGLSNCTVSVQITCNK